jgi:hypothetical protein
MKAARQPSLHALHWGATLGILMTTTACTSTHPSPITAPTAIYRKAIEQAPFEKGEQAKAGLERLAAFFADFSESNVTQTVRGVYAKDAYLRDGFKELQGVEAIAPYMIRSAAALRTCSFDFEDVAVHGGDHYIRWVMHTNLKRDAPERVAHVIGMSHVRFDSEGRVAFQQDYWDPSDVLYSRIPVAGWLIEKVKSTL